MSTQPEPMVQATATAEPSGDVDKVLQEKKSSARVQDAEADEDMRGLDVVEQKMILINRVINSQGMGRYQVCQVQLFATSLPVFPTDATVICLFHKYSGACSHFAVSVTSSIWPLHSCSD